MNRLFINTAVAAALAVLPATVMAQTTHYTPVETGK